MSKKARLFFILTSGLLVLLIGSGLLLSAAAFRRQARANEEIGQLNGRISGLSEQLKDLQTELANQPEPDDAPDDGEDVARENDVRIAEDYVIRSTEQISDAYLSGDTSALSDKDKETLRMASSILSQIIQEGMTDYEKEKAVYEWMTVELQFDTGVLPVIPDTGADCDNPFGVLKYHNAVCVGYATTFRLFMQMLEIPCMVVHNSERYHSWDLVRLDGEWYHTDIYSDAGNPNYTHFNLTDSMMACMQDWNTDFFPAADGYEYCYAYQISAPEEDIYHVPVLMREALDSKDSMVSLRFDNSIFEGNDQQILEMMLDQIRDRLSSNAHYNNSMYMDYNMNALENECLLVITYTWYDEEDPDWPGEEISDEEYEKINDAVEDSFGDIPFDMDYDW